MFFNSILQTLSEAYSNYNSFIISMVYGLLLYMGIDMFVTEGLFRGIKLIFIDRSLFNEGQQGVVSD